MLRRMMFDDINLVIILRIGKPEEFIVPQGLIYHVNIKFSV